LKDNSGPRLILNSPPPLPTPPPGRRAAACGGRVCCLHQLLGRLPPPRPPRAWGESSKPMVVRDRPVTRWWATGEACRSGGRGEWSVPFRPPPLQRREGGRGAIRSAGTHPSVYGARGSQSNRLSKAWSPSQGSPRFHRTGMGPLQQAKMGLSIAGKRFIVESVGRFHFLTKKTTPCYHAGRSGTRSNHYQLPY